MKTALVTSAVVLLVAIAYVEYRLPKVEPDLEPSSESADVADLEERVAALEDWRAEREVMQPTAAPTEAAPPAEAAPVEAAATPEAAPRKKPAGNAEAVREFLAKLAGGTVTEDDLNPLWNVLPGSGLEDEAIAAFEKYLKDHPNDADANYGLGIALTSKLTGGNVSLNERGSLSMRADMMFSKALEIDDHHFGARFSKAFSYTFWPAAFGKGPEAIKHFEILRKRHGGDTDNRMMPMVYSALGSEYKKAGNFEKAREVYEEAVRNYPDSQEFKDLLKAMGK